MAPSGQCQPFSADAQATVWGEGAAAIVTKRLSDAQRDNMTQSLRSYPPSLSTMADAAPA
ncbi:uncharacterized protein BDW70DRAFT_145717 [Aspergillus foveolatus]|uniref:uncharacterized protein n=1 Tax=Aspergillus foveolatus TaxID=210207 RepID=UPI003CCD5429